MSRLEEWVDIKDFEGMYQISNHGRVKSFKRDKNGRVMSSKDNGHYYQIILCKNGVQKRFSVHRLVAMHFIPNPDDKPQVNHIDGNKRNNHVSNLEWVTNGENEKHAYMTGLKESAKGEKHGRSKLSEAEVLSIYHLMQTGKFKTKEVASMFDVHFCTVSDIARGYRWEHLTNKARQALQNK
ncbi:NUMOD4 domain-containing protein [Gracilibacillus thailandensis]|uniref:Endonuclease n=1 Tax=Gracilibacillus thailandensis TaxID=563735 RepID=A0A6N7QVG7_9BACI|nr:NUMOD4 domain-containing protein [Gracilibacillus thailandensis]MRI65142.1 endonuclease [Gracilibacillus thailandensis]